MAAPDSAAIASYLSATGLPSWSDEELSAALAAESAAQAHVCVVPADDEDWPADLSAALCRRVSRALALRKFPVGVMTSEVANTRVGAWDREIARLEAPYRRWVVA